MKLPEKIKNEKIERARLRRMELKQPRDWQELWYCYCMHIIQGGIAGSLAVVAIFQQNNPLSLLALTITAIYIGYQGLSFARKHDTVGRDLADYGYGWGLGAFLMFLKTYLIEKL